MKTMRMLYRYIFTILIGIPLVVNADGTTFNNPLKTGLSTFSGFVEALLHTAIFILFPLAVLAIVYSGFLFVSAQGNEEKLTKAKNNFLWTVVGVTLLLGAWALASLISGTIEPILRP